MKYFFSSRLTERATWRGGKRLQTSGGERAGRSGWYFTLFSSFFGIHQQCVSKEVLVCLSSSDHHGGPLPIVKTNEEFLICLPLNNHLRVACYGDWPGIFASSCQTIMQSTPMVNIVQKSQIKKLLWLAGIFSQLLKRLNYDEEEMMANMGGYRLYRSVSFDTTLSGFQSLSDQNWYFIRIILQCCHPLCGKRGKRKRTWNTFSKVEQVLNRYIDWCVKPIYFGFPVKNCMLAWKK